jgi:hypothetical protein
MVAKKKTVKKKPIAKKKTVKKPVLVVKKKKSFWEKVKSFFKGE